MLTCSSRYQKWRLFALIQQDVFLSLQPNMLHQTLCRASWGTVDQAMAFIVDMWSGR